MSYGFLTYYYPVTYLLERVTNVKNMPFAVYGGERSDEHGGQDD